MPLVDCVLRAAAHLRPVIESLAVRQQRTRQCDAAQLTFGLKKRFEGGFFPLQSTHTSLA